MAGADYNLNMVINARSNATSVLSGLAGSLGAIGPAAILASAALAGIGLVAADSVQKAANFQAQLTQLVTGANESASNLNMVGQGILKMSVDTATGTDKLNSAMFLVESAGYHGAAGLTLLKAAAQGARADNADLTQTTDVLTTAMHDYNLSAAAAIPTMNSLIVTVSNGKMHMDQLNASLTNVLPVSSALKVKLSDVEGALATMASSGDRGASAGTHLAMMLKMLSNPASTAQKEMKAMGIDSIKLAQTMQTSLPGALAMIQNAVAQHFVPGSVQYNRAIAAILGGSKSGIAGLEIMGHNFKDLQTNSNSAAASMTHAGTSVQGFAAVQKTFSFQMDATKQAMNAAQIQIGQKLLPVLTKLLTALTPLITAFANWVSTLHANSPAIAVLGGILAGLAVIVMVAVVPALIAAAGGFLAITVAGAPLWIIILAVIAVVTAIILVIQHWGAISQWLAGVWKGTTSAIGGFFSALGTRVHQDLDIMGQDFKTATDKAGQMKDSIGQHFSDLGTNVHSKLTDIGTNVLNEWNKINGTTDTSWSQVGATAMRDVNNMKNMIGNYIGQLVSNFVTSLINLKNQAGQQAANIVSTITGFLSQLPAMALRWGQDLIQNLINGISSMLPNLSNIASQAANQIASVLHFTHPSKGPLMTVEQWMPHLGDTLVMGLNNIAPQLQAAALRAAASVAGPIKGTSDVSGMPSHIFDFIGSNYSGYSSGMATTAKREQAADNKAARQAAALAKQETALESHIQKLEQHYHIVVNAHGKGKWTKADATELAKLLAEQTRLQGKHPQTASGRRN